MAGKDKYGIPPGGNNGPYTAKRWAGISYTLPWRELMASIALAGWPQQLWGMAGAVAAAESGRNPFVYNTYKMGHFGLFQISRAAWPDFFTVKDGTDLGWVNPENNAGQAYKIYKAQGWGAWQAKTNGAYLAFYPQALAAAADLDRLTQQHGQDEHGYWRSLISSKTQDLEIKAAGVSAADIAKFGNEQLGGAVAGAANATAAGVVDSGAAVASAVNDTFGFLPDLWTAITTPALWMRLGYGALGVVLVAGGLFLIVRQRPGVQRAVNVATSIVPGGGALKAAKGA